MSYITFRMILYVVYSESVSPIDNCKQIVSEPNMTQMVKCPLELDLILFNHLSIYVVFSMGLESHPLPLPPQQEYL